MHIPFDPTLPYLPSTLRTGWPLSCCRFRPGLEKPQRRSVVSRQTRGRKEGDAHTRRAKRLCSSPQRHHGNAASGVPHLAGGTGVLLPGREVSVGMGRDGEEPGVERQRRRRLRRGEGRKKRGREKNDHRSMASYKTQIGSPFYSHTCTIYFSSFDRYTNLKPIGDGSYGFVCAADDSVRACLIVCLNIDALHPYKSLCPFLQPTTYDS